MKIKHILVTTDFSPASFSAFEVAREEAKCFSAKVSLLSVCENFSIPAILLRELPDKSTVERLKAKYQEEKRQEVRTLAEEHFPDLEDVASVCLFGVEDISGMICDYVHEHKVDLIVIASHGRGSLERFFLGNVAQKVIQDAGVPILVVPVKELKEGGE